MTSIQRAGIEPERPPLTAGDALDRPRARRRLLALLALGIGLCASFLCAEIVLRYVGYHTWRSLRPQNQPILLEPDEVLGWRNKAGRYQIPPFSSEGTETFVANWPGGRRATAEREVPGRPTVAIVGCSFTEGAAVSDSDTFAWKLQQKYPALEFQNYGTNAYGTYQCLLVMERVLKAPHPPRLALYGFYEHHELRNVADPLWLRGLMQYSGRGFEGVPYCTLGTDGELQRHPPELFTAFPLHEYLATSVLAELVCMKWKTSRRVVQGREVTQKLMLEMDQLCRRKGVVFVTAFLSISPESLPDYERFCQSNHIHAIHFSQPLTPKMRVPGEGHPNPRMHELWATEIDRGIHDLVVPGSSIQSR